MKFLTKPGRLSKLAVFLIIVFTGCTYLTDADNIISRTREEGGGEKYQNASIEFDAANKHFIVKGNKSIFSDSTFLVLLPFLLNDSSVTGRYLGDTMIENKIFYIIGINNSQHEVRYWIDRNDFAIGYIAYSQPNTTSLRFCKLINCRMVNDIRFCDFINHRPKNSSASIDDLELLFTKGELLELSRIEVQNIRVF